MNKVQVLFDELIKRYNLRAITIEGETWYSVNDLPLGKDAVRKAIQRLEKNNQKNFVNDNTRIIKNLDIISNHSRNFDKINNAGERFGSEIMVVYLIQNSHMSITEKEKYLSLFNINVVSTRKEIEFLDQLEESLKPFNIKGIRQYYILSYRIDYYIPSLNIAIEYDENDHKNYTYEQHEGRQKEIEKELNCKFIRVSDKNTNSYNVGLVIKDIFNL